jgi:hypothetical protein
MAYNQQYDSGYDQLPPDPHPRAYADPWQHRGERSNYRERPPNNQQYDSYEHEAVQQPEDYGYQWHEEQGGAGGYYRDGYNGGPPNDRNRGYRSPLAQYDTRGHHGDAKRQPMQQYQQKQLDPRHRGIPNSPALQPSSEQYPPDPRRDLNQNRRNRPQHNGIPDPRRDDRPAENDYGRRDGHHGSQYDVSQQQDYYPKNDWQNQSHRRGRSNGDEEHGYSDPRGAAPHDGRTAFAAQRPGRDQERSRSHGRQYMDKRKIFTDTTSPDTVAWDNPFPTFPAGKTKGIQDDGNMTRSMADMRLSDRTLDPSAPRPRTTDNSDRYGTERYQNRHDEPHSGTQQPNWKSGGATPVPARVPEAPVGALERPPADYGRPRPFTRRSSEEVSRGAARLNKAIQPDAERSRTMPNNVSSAVMSSGFQTEHSDTHQWQEPGHTTGYYGPEDAVYVPGRPSTASGTRPSGPVQSRSNEIQQLRNKQTRPQQGNGVSNVQTTQDHPPSSRQDSIGDVYDSYYNGSTPASPAQSHRGYRAYQPPIEEEMPNFDATSVASPSHHRGMTIDDHLQPQQIRPEMPPLPNQYQDRHAPAFDRIQAHGQAPRSRSQPDLKNRRPPRAQPNDGFDFGIPPEATTMPPRSHQRNGPQASPQYPIEGPPTSHDFDRQQPAFRDGPRQPPIPYRANVNQRPSEPYPQQSLIQAPPEQYRPPVQQRPSQNGQIRGPGGRPSPDSRAGPTSPPASLPMQPDALPAHPAPVRAGLMSSPSPPQAPKPVPVRNYNTNSSPLQNLSTPLAASSSRPSEVRRAPAPVTQGELDGLRQNMKVNPSDQKTPILLAKKLMEAVASLDEGVPRLDQKTIQKTRERYYAEAYKIVKRLVSAGSADGMFFLGDCYSQGRLDLEKDTREAFTLYQSAAKAGHAQAAFRVAVCCELGLEEDGGTKRDLGKAVQWYKRAAQLGDTPAMYKTGVIQLKGLLGQPKDTAEAVVWLRRAAEKADKDNPHALHELVSHAR